jgi:hypothetical protein
MLMAGKYPARLLSPFVHELVHHWCFHSPVGLALAHLQLRARREILLLAEPREESKFDHAFNILEDVSRYEAVVTLMRPLAEGMALFAEFDLMPGESSAISLVARWVGYSFGSVHEDEELADPSSQISELLSRHRLSQDCNSRKSNLLADPLTCDSGGYLPGYLLVKNLWFTLVHERGCVRLEDKDLYLMYLRAFFYEDMGFVATLLDRSVTELQALENIATYFQLRFRDLLQTTDESVNVFEEFVSARRADSKLEVEEIFPIALHRGLKKAGQDRLRALVAEVEFEGEPTSLEEILKRQDQWTLAQRELMCIGRFPEYVRVNKHGQVHVGQLKGEEDSGFTVPILAVGALENVTPTEGEGLVEFFISPSGMYRYSAISVQGELVAIVPLSKKLSEPLLQQLQGYQVDSERVMNQKRAVQAVIEQYLHQEGFDVFLAHYRSEVARISNEFYVSRSLIRTSDDKVEACAATMRDTGLYAVLERDGRALRALASASLTNSISSSAAFTGEILAHHGISLDELLASCAKARIRHDVPLLEVYGEFLVSFV